jgi:Mn2+/Fe2+ NRAMP family transporter
MLASEIAAWSIIVVTATVLHRDGVTDIRTAADAAKALEPLVMGFPHSGFLAKALFASGVVGLGFLAVPVLAGSASYGLSEAFNWNEGLYLKLRQAHGFYGIITIATVAGLSINFIGIDPVKALIFSAVFNGVAAVPLIYLILRISRNKAIMGEYRSRWLSSSLVWLTFIAMGCAAIAMIATIGK